MYGIHTHALFFSNERGRRGERSERKRDVNWKTDLLLWQRNSCWQTRATNIDLICTCLQIHLARRVAHIASCGAGLCVFGAWFMQQNANSTNHHPPSALHPSPIASASFKWVKPCPSRGDPLDQRLSTGYLRCLRASGLGMLASGLLWRFNGSVMHTLLAFPC